jgi:ribokinase
MARMSEIIVVGFISIDFIGHVEGLPTTLVAAKASEFDVACGGRAANQAMAVTAIEGSVSLIARVGNDQHADLLTDELRELGVGSETVAEAPESTGLRLIAELPDGNQAAIVYRGANDYLSVDDLNRNAQSFTDARAVGITTEPMGAVVLRALELAKTGGARSVLTYHPGLPISDRVLGSADVLVLSDLTCNGLLDPEIAERQPDHAARALCQRGAPAVVLLTADRALLATPAQIRQVQSPGQLHREDSVDAFVAGMLQAFASGESLEEGVVRGVRVANLLID